MNCRAESRHGFTLIELSIVLVIIGLLTGAVLVGRDMITAAERRAVISEEEGLQTAVNTFKTKYNCLPGDCLNASDYGFTDPSGIINQYVPQTNGNGNGDGIIGIQTGYLFDGYNNNDYERVTFWEQLNQAGLIKEALNASIYPGVGTVYSSLRQNQWIAGHISTPIGNGFMDSNVFAIVGPLGCTFQTCGGAHWSESLTSEEAYSIDSKIDDGLPNTGSVIATVVENFIYTQPNAPDTGANPPNECTNVFAANSYANPAINTNIRCELLFKMQTQP